jgi:hypothetical protein
VGLRLSAHAFMAHQAIEKKALPAQAVQGMSTQATGGAGASMAWKSAPKGASDSLARMRLPAPVRTAQEVNPQSACVTNKR